MRVDFRQVAHDDATAVGNSQQEAWPGHYTAERHRVNDPAQRKQPADFGLFW